MLYNFDDYLFLDSRTLFKLKTINQLFKLVHKQKQEELQILLSNNRVRNLVDFNAANDYGETLLHLAAKCENEEIVKLCLKIGADPFMKNKKGKIAMELAKKQSIRDLLKQGTYTCIYLRRTFLFMFISNLFISFISSNDKIKRNSK